MVKIEAIIEWAKKEASDILVERSEERNNVVRVTTMFISKGELKDLVKVSGARHYTIFAEVGTVGKIVIVLS